MALPGTLEGRAGGHLGCGGDMAIARMDRVLSKAERAEGKNTLASPIFPF